MCIRDSYHTLRGKLLFEPSDTLEIQIAADYTSREENCCTAVQTVLGSSSVVLNALTGGQALPIASPPFPAKADPFARVAYSNRSTEQDIKEKGISAEVNWEMPWLGGATLTSITADRDWQAINGLDYDFSTADMLYRNANEDESLSRFDTFSQEFRLTGATAVSYTHLDVYKRQAQYLPVTQRAMQPAPQQASAHRGDGGVQHAEQGLSLIHI